MFFGGKKAPCFAIKSVGENPGGKIGGPHPKGVCVNPPPEGVWGKKNGWEDPLKGEK